MCFICRRTGDCSDKSLLSQVKAHSLLTRLVLPRWAFSEIEPEMEISHAYKAALPKWTSTPCLRGPAGSGETLSAMQGWRFVILKPGSNGPSGYRLACPLLLLAVLCIAPFIRARDSPKHIKLEQLRSAVKGRGVQPGASWWAEMSWRSRTRAAVFSGCPVFWSYEPKSQSGSRGDNLQLPWLRTSSHEVTALTSHDLSSL